MIFSQYCVNIYCVYIIISSPSAYQIFVIFFTRAKFLVNKIYTEKARKLRQNTQKIANFLRYYGKIHSKLPIFRVKSVKIYTGQKNLHWRRQRQLSGMVLPLTQKPTLYRHSLVICVIWQITPPHNGHLYHCELVAEYSQEPPKWLVKVLTHANRKPYGCK